MFIDFSFAYTMHSQLHTYIHTVLYAWGFFSLPSTLQISICPARARALKYFSLDIPRINLFYFHVPMILYTVSIFAVVTYPYNVTFINLSNSLPSVVD